MGLGGNTSKVEQVWLASAETLAQETLVPFAFNRSTDHTSLATQNISHDFLLFYHGAAMLIFFVEERQNVTLCAEVVKNG